MSILSYNVTCTGFRDLVLISSGAIIQPTTLALSLLSFFLPQFFIVSFPSPISFLLPSLPTLAFFLNSILNPLSFYLFFLLLKNQDRKSWKGLNDFFPCSSVTVKTELWRRFVWSFHHPCCKQICCHTDFVFPFVEHRQSQFSIILKCPGIFIKVNKHWLPLQVTSCISS